jgi:hypothetical protein
MRTGTARIPNPIGITRVRIASEVIIQKNGAIAAGKRLEKTATAWLSSSEATRSILQN